MEPKQCPVCKSSGAFSLTEKFETGAFYRCVICGTEFAYPMEVGTDVYYETSYGATGAGYGEYKWEYFELLKDLKKLGVRGKLLEIGSGPGYFLKFAEAEGFEVYGVDFNKATVEHAKKLGLSNMHVGAAEDAPKIFSNLQFEVVVLFSILEHLQDPRATLNEIASIVKTGGYLAVVVPDRERYILKINVRAKREGWDYPPHHLTRWDSDSVRGALVNSGFYPILVKPEPIRTLPQVFGFTRGFLALVLATGTLAKARAEAGGEYSQSKVSLKRKILTILSRVKAVIIFLAALVLTPVFLVPSIFRSLRGTNLYVLAQKK